MDDGVYLSWESTCYPDGGLFEGLVDQGQCSFGVFQYADGDRFEGSYENGAMSGLGVYRWSNGSIFKGQWKDNNMHGCGKKWYPGGALEEGEWVEDNFVGDFGACDAAEAQATAMDAERVAERAREFMFKPDGDVSYKMGLSLDQEPSVYTAGSEYLMPGPAGNLYKVPNDPAVRRALVEQARKARAVYQSVNMPPPTPEMLEHDNKADQARKAMAAAAAAAAPPPSARAAAGKLQVDEEDDDEDDDEPAPPAAGARPPRGAASLSLCLVQSSAAMARAFAQAGRALRRRRLGQPSRC